MAKKLVIKTRFISLDGGGLLPPPNGKKFWKLKISAEDLAKNNRPDADK